MANTSVPSVKAVETEKRLGGLINTLATGVALTDQGSCLGDLDADAHQGAPSTPGNIGAAGAYTTAYAQAQSDRINDLQGNVNGDLNAAVNRINDLIDAHNALTSDMDNLITRVNTIIGALQTANIIT